MEVLPKSISLAATLAVAAFFALPALAHHGWSWTQDGFFELKGVIADIYIGNPHATLDVDVEGELRRQLHAPQLAFDFYVNRLELSRSRALSI